MKLVFATNNKHKFKEIQEVLCNKVELLNLKDLGFSGEIPEDKKTLEENAAQKAYFIYNKFGLDCFADDTGLEIKALNGEPGVYSARYAGKNCNFEDNMNKVLTNMVGKTDRTACFRTIISLVKSGELILFEGVIKGVILEVKKGNFGFGYDPVFQPEGYDKTFAEMTLEEKNKISHRSLAIHKLTDYLIKNYT
jgi:XTP/dITP diphosphohydrolase